MGRRKKTVEVDQAFALIEQAAINGERCPQTEPFGPLKHSLTTMLARQGRIQFGIYALNWRVATIMEGPHKGKHTLLPKRGKPYKIVGKETLHVTRLTNNERRPEPSLPRPLTREELA